MRGRNNMKVRKGPLSIDNISEVLSSDIVIDEELIGKRYCKCGSATHQRTSFKSCLLNKNNRIKTYNKA